MHMEPLEVYSRESNYAIVKPPGRRFPGCVIQGDSLSILCAHTRTIADVVSRADIASEEFLEAVEDLNNELIWRILHYQAVLAKHGIKLPYAQPFSEADIVRLLPDD
jgi:predicted RNase H-like HicB family nuclease